MSRETKVVNVKVKYIRPEYQNLREWCEGEANVYIGRKGVVFVNKTRYPKHNSVWSNPYKITNRESREDVLKKYREYIINKIELEGLHEKLLELKGKNLGCWCKPEECHGDILVSLIEEYSKL